jgi:hypothetical protein
MLPMKSALTSQPSWMDRFQQLQLWQKLIPFVLIDLIIVGLVIFLLKTPSNDRDWAEEFAVLPEPTIQGDVVKIKNIRDWRYTSQGPISKNYITREFKVSELERVWFMVEPFSGWDGVAHTYFVFDFKNQEPVALSIEARREKTESFNFITGLMRQFDLIYIWGTEQDLTASRVITYRNQVYMYPLMINQESGQKLFLSVVNETAQLVHQPRFYNTITSNCTSNLADHANRVQSGAVPYHYARFLPGYSAQLLYDLKLLDTAQSLDQLKSKYHINQVVEQSYQDASFSRILRQNLIP